MRIQISQVWHAGRYTIMVQPQPGCVNLRHAGRTNHHIDHHMTLRPYHSHHTLQKQVRRTTCSTKVALRKPLQRESNGIYGIPMKISSEWSHHLKSEPFIMSQFSLGTKNYMQMIQTKWSEPSLICKWSRPKTTQDGSATTVGNRVGYASITTVYTQDICE